MCAQVSICVSCSGCSHTLELETLLNSSESLRMWQIWQQAMTRQQGPHISETESTAKHKPDVSRLGKIHNTIQCRHTHYSPLHSAPSPPLVSHSSQCPSYLPEGRNSRVNTPGVKQGWWGTSDWLFHIRSNFCDGWGLKLDEKSLVCKWTFSKRLVNK